MIARSLILFLLLIVIPDTYLYRVWVRHTGKSWLKVLWWGISAFLLVYTLWLAHCPDFIPQNPWILFVYLLILGVYTLPKVLFTLALLLEGTIKWLKTRIAKEPEGSAQADISSSHASRRAMLSPQRIWQPSMKAVLPATILSAGLIWMVGYGVSAGFNQFEVRRMDYKSPQLPPAFDGYKVALFSDAHVGSYVTQSGCRQLAQAMDSLNALGADLIVFTGDLQNARALEIAQHSEPLARLKAPDGVMAILGNHDYAMYIDGSPEEKSAAEAATLKQIRALGWDLLLNEHRFITRGADTLVVGGMENYGKPPFPSRGDVKQTLRGVSDNNFVLMLQHDPYAWRHEILPKSGAQLTLSGHTHGGQVNLGGVSPYAVIGGEYEGLYHYGDRSLFVTRGLGGLIPFRFGVSGEIVLITLHCASASPESH